MTRPCYPPEGTGVAPVLVLVLLRVLVLVLE
jgi:hypothetical protein